MEDPPVNLGKSYGDVTNIVYFSFFYNALIPISCTVGLLQLCLYYTIDKYNILRRRSIKNIYDAKLTKVMPDLIELGIVILEGSNIMFSMNLFPLVPKLSFLVFGLALCFYRFPTQKLIKILKFMGLGKLLKKNVNLTADIEFKTA